MHWVLGHAGLFLNTVGDIHVLPRVLDAANRFTKAPSAEEMEALLARQQLAPLFT